MYAISPVFASEHAPLDLVKVLLSKGANVHAKDHKVGRHMCTIAALSICHVLLGSDFVAAVAYMSQAAYLGQ